MIKNLNPEYIKNSHNSIIKRIKTSNIKMGKTLGHIHFTKEDINGP